jgi:hypothetical protein
MTPTIRLTSLIHAMLLLALLLALPSACRGANDDPAPPVTPPALAPCGMDDASIPDFTLTDDNAMSPTFTQEFALSDYSGKVLLIFWMRAT